MATSTLVTRLRPRATRRPRRRGSPGPVVAAERRPVPRLELEPLALRWQLALDAAQRATASAGISLPATEVAPRRRELVRERQQTAETLARVAKEAGIREVPWLSPVPVTPAMLGLPTTVQACLFDLDGVLTDSGKLHAWAWGEVFDELLLRLGERVEWHFIPFDREADYHDYLDGRPRLEGVHAFLDSRGIRLPEGRVDDPAQADTAYGLARHKGETLARALQQHGPSTLAGARRYLAAAGRARIARGVVSASASTSEMLDLTGLAALVEDSLDAFLIEREELRSRPAPDVLLAACRRLGVPPEAAVTFTHSEAGVAAGHAAGLMVIGVGDGLRGERLEGFGADRVVPSLSELLGRGLGAD